MSRLIVGQFKELGLQRREQKDLELLNWLSPESHWLVDAQIHGRISDIRGERSLQWATEMDEFRNWRTSERNSKERVLWIRGGPGIGKSTLSAYLVQILKHTYPTSIIAYFFCKSGQAGLTQPRDIIRTITYQCAAQDSEIRGRIEKLKLSGFPIDGTMGINFILQKLLREPLESCSREIFVILDGVDEADMTVKDAMTRMPEIYGLISSFAKLCSRIRLLLVSRASLDVQQFVPDCIVRTLGPKDNANDIQEYISKALDENPKLERRFRDAQIDPKRYFSEHAKGMFLWVTLGLQQLSDIRSKSAFCRSLKTFSEAPGNLSKLYLEILSQIRVDDRIWVKEILQWILVCKRPFTVKELQAAVEYSLGDEMDRF